MGEVHDFKLVSSTGGSRTAITIINNNLLASDLSIFFLSCLRTYACFTWNFKHPSKVFMINHLSWEKVYARTILVLPY